MTYFNYNWLPILVIIVLLFSILFFSSKKIFLFKYSHLIDAENFKNHPERYLLYFLVASVYVPLTEIIIEQYHLRTHSEIIPNLVTGFVSFVIYLISTKYYNLYKNLPKLFVIIFSLFSITILFKIVSNPQNLINVSEFTLVIAFSYYAFYRFRDFVIQNLFFSICLIIATFFNKISIQNFMLYECIIIMSFALNFSKHLIDENFSKNLSLSHTIVNASSMISIAIHNNGTIKYLSENSKKLLQIENNLHYIDKPLESLIQINFTDLNEALTNKKNHVQQIVNKSGELKYFQWEKITIGGNQIYLLGSDVTDITILKNNSLNYSNRLKILLENTSDLVFILNNELFITDIYTRSPEELLLPKSFVINKKIDAVQLPIDILLKLDTAISKIKNTDFSTSIEYALEINKKMQWYELKITPVNDKYTTTTEYICVARNITDQKNNFNTQKELQEYTYRQNKVLLELSFSSIDNYSSLENYYQTVTENICYALGINRVSIWEYANKEITCRSMFNAESNTHTKGTILAEHLFPNYFNAIKSRMIIKAVDVLNDPDTADFIDAYFSPSNIMSLLDIAIRIDGELTGILCCEQTGKHRSWTDDDVNFGKHITNMISLFTTEYKRKKTAQALEESERYFKYINETIEDVFWLFDIEKKEVVYVSPSCQKIFGYSPDAYYAKYNLWKDYTLEEDIPKVVDAHEKITQHKFFEVEFRIRKDGEIKWIYEKSFAIEDEHGNVIKNSGICIDITKQKLIELQIQKNKELEGENKSKAAFLANMSHELRTPLNGVIGLTDLLKKTPLNELQKKYVYTVNESANLLQGIINNILDFSKIDSDTFELTQEIYNLNYLCSNIVDIMRFHAEQKGLTLQFELAEDVPSCLYIDEIRFKQILLNLLGNALKFTEKGNIDFSIKEITIDEKKLIRFSIKDTGIGIKDENLSKIFIAFTQADSSTTKKYGGTGLGLAISSKLLLMMNSKLQVESKLNEGSNFYFDFPIEQFNNDKSLCIKNNNIDLHEKELAQLASSSSSVTLLLVEDNKVNMFLLKAILFDMIPFAVFHEVTDGQQAIEWIKNNNADLIYMDIQMPVKNGYEAAQEIRQLPNGKEIPIIAITASAVQGEKEKCLQAGMNDYITKPIISTTIEKSLFDWLPSKFNKKVNVNSNQSAHIDVQKLNNENLNNGIYLKSIFPYIKESLVEGLAEIKQFAIAKDIHSISIVAHRIKGTALTASFTLLAELCKTLEYTEMYEENSIKDLIDKIEAEINYLLTVL